MAFDTNTVANCQGCVPVMNCDVVRIFRKHGFAWGGNFREPDGMHFEWVDERRDQISYPSDYCPNVILQAQSGEPSAGVPEGASNVDIHSLGIDVLIVGSVEGHDHN